MDSGGSFLLGLSDLVWPVTSIRILPRRAELKEHAVGTIVSRLVVVLLVLAWTIPSSAQNTVGYGRISCELWTKERRSESAMSLAYSAWVLGFVSGVNAIGILQANESQDFLRTAVLKDMITWVDDFCVAHPNYNLDTAGFALIDALKGR